MKIFIPNHGSIWDCYSDNSFPDGLLVSLVENDQAGRKESSAFHREGASKSPIPAVNNTQGQEI